MTTEPPGRALKLVGGGESGQWRRAGGPRQAKVPPDNPRQSDPLQKEVDSLFVFVVKIDFSINLKGGPLQEPK